MTKKRQVRKREQNIRQLQKREKHTLDIFMMVALPLFATIYTISFGPPFLLTALLYLGLPALWLSLRAPRTVIKSGIFGLVFSLPLSFIIDYLAVEDGAWYVSQSFFARLLGNVVIEDILWSFLFVYFVVIFYEYFFDHITREHTTPRLKVLLYITLTLIFAFFLIYLVNPSLLALSYAYLWMGIVFSLLPLVLIFLKLPKLVFKFLGVTAYFFIFCLLYEVTALRAGLWTFPGENFIGRVSLLGVQFPLEEGIFWMLLSTGTILAIYEYFDDDGR